MKIAFLLPSDRLSGGNLVVYEHSSILTKLGHEVSVIFRAWEIPAGLSKTEVPQKTLQALPGAPLWYGTLGFQGTALDWTSALECSFDLVIATWWETAYEVFELKSRAYGYFVQSDERKFYAAGEKFSRAGVELSYHLPFIYFTEASWIQKLLKEEFSHDAFLIPNGVSLEKFKPVEPLQPKRPGVMRVLVEGAGSVPYKRVGFAFEVLREISGIEVWYVCGDGYRDPSWKVDNFLGSTLPDEMSGVYSSCDVLLKLSVVEGFFLPPLEMMACGGTVVVTNVSGHEEYVRHEENALVVEMDNKAQAVEALMRLRDDPALLKKLKGGALQTAQGLSWDRARVAYEKTLSRINLAAAPSGAIKVALKFLPELKMGLSRWETQRSPADQIYLTQRDAKILLDDLDRQFKEIVSYFKLYTRASAFEDHERRLRNIEIALRGFSILGGIATFCKRGFRRLKQAAKSVLSPRPS